MRDGDAALSLSISYTYEVSPVVGVGAIADYSGPPIKTLLIAPALWLRPIENLLLLGAPGVEFESGQGSEPAVRLGAAYSIPVGEIHVTPLVYWDLVKDRVGSVVIGLAIGKGF